MKKLNKYVWGLGIEHEMHIFHKPLIKNNIQDFILFNSEDAVKRLLDKDNSNLNEDDYKFLKTVPFELSGRKCSGVSVIQAVPIEMPEFITSDPFCSIPTNHNLINITQNIVLNKERFYKILMKDKITQELVKKYGSLSEYPFGMTRYLKCPLKIKNNKYLFEKNKLWTEYNGSYHVTFTLPYTDKTNTKEFIKMHKNFCNQLQWLEPLLLTSYFSGDEYAPGTLKERVRGSFRVMIIGWGNLAGTDVRFLNKGIGRYAKTPTYWRKGLHFKDSEKLKACYKPSPLALREKAITSLSSDFRTFGSTDPSRPMNRESGAPMNIPNGVEFRIFDHFNDESLESLVTLISLVAENSRTKKTRGYVYENKIWIDEVHNIMKNGYKAQLSNEYIKLLRKKLGLEINTYSIIAIDIFKQIYKELFDKNINGEWSKIFFCLEKPDRRSIILPEINKRAWQFAFMIQLNREKDLLYKFNLLSNYLNDIKTIEIKNFSIAIKEIFGKNWKNDIEDIAYFYESLINENEKFIYNSSEINNINGNALNQNYVELIKNRDGTIQKLEILINIPIFKNFNHQMEDYFSNNNLLINTL